MTVKQYKDLLEEMKTVYPYKDEKTKIDTSMQLAYSSPRLEIQTEDEKTGVTIVMSKSFDGRYGE